MEAARPPAPGLGCGRPPSRAVGRVPVAVSGPAARRDEAPKLRPEGPGPIAAPRTGPAPQPQQGPAVGEDFVSLELALPPELRAAELWGPQSWVGVAPGPQSAHIPVPAQRPPPGRVRLDEVMAAAALTSLSTSPLLLGAPATAFSSEPGLEPWKEVLGQPPGSYGSSSNSGDWDLASDPSSPSTPSPPLPLEAAHFLFGEPAPRKRKNSAQVMFQCLWKSCGKVLSSAAGMQRHIRVVHLGRQAEAEQSDGEEDFYYTELDIGVDTLTDRLSSFTPVSPTTSEPATFPRLELPEPSALPPSPVVVPRQVCHIHSDHAYQGCLVPLPLEPQPPTVRACFAPALPSKLTVNPRKPRGDAKKCRKVYGLEHRDLWCMACRWKKACQRFLD
ncbi:SLC2A4 regulator [Rhynchocyon petersi]